MLSHVFEPSHPVVDNWGGYPATRERILRHWRDARIANPLVLSGDIHAFAAADLPDPDRPDAPPIPRAPGGPWRISRWPRGARDGQGRPTFRLFAGVQSSDR
jgi:hypothetical protein